MAIERWNPWREFGSLQERINRMFDETLRGISPAGREGIEGATWAPALDIQEMENNYLVRADLPGVKREDIQINLRDNTLTIRGERKIEEEVSKENYMRMERAYGAFARSFTLPQNVDPDKIQAKHKDGVLELTIPKTEEAKPKQIKIEES